VVFGGVVALMGHCTSEEARIWNAGHIAPGRCPGGRFGAGNVIENISFSWTTRYIQVSCKFLGTEVDVLI